MRRRNSGRHVEAPDAVTPPRTGARVREERWLRTTLLQRNRSRGLAPTAAVGAARRTERSSCPLLAAPSDHGKDTLSPTTLSCMQEGNTLGAMQAASAMASLPAEADAPRLALQPGQRQKQQRAAALAVGLGQGRSPAAAMSRHRGQELCVKPAGDELQDPSDLSDPSDLFILLSPDPPARGRGHRSYACGGGRRRRR